MASREDAENPGILVEIRHGDGNNAEKCCILRSDAAVKSGET
jgi:hypothetical protein